MIMKKNIGMITTTKDNPNSKPYGSPQLLKYQASHKWYIKFWQAKKQKPPDKKIYRQQNHEEKLRKG